MKQWLLSDFQKNLIFSGARHMKAKLRKQEQCIECMSIQIKMLFDKLHERQERVREARELLISMPHALVGGASKDLMDIVNRFIEEESE